MQKRKKKKKDNQPKRRLRKFREIKSYVGCGPTHLDNVRLLGKSIMLIDWTVVAMLINRINFLRTGGYVVSFLTD